MELTPYFLMCREEEVSQRPRKKAQSDPESNPTPGTGEGAGSSSSIANMTIDDALQAGDPETVAQDHQEEELQESSPGRNYPARTSPARTPPARTTSEVIPDADVAARTTIEGEEELVQTTIPGAFP